MALSNLLRHSCNTSRLQSTGTNGRRVMTANLTNVPCMFTPMSDHQAVEGGYSISQAYTVFFKPGTDIQRADKLAYNGTSFIVRGIKPFVNFGPVSYLQASVELEQANG